MEIFKIRKKYCTDDKVQLMLSNSPQQIICSADGYAFLRDSELILHKYIEDKQRFKLPYHDKPISESHVNHLFEYNKLYIKATSDRNMVGGYSLASDSLTITFLYFIKLKDGDALCAEIPLSHFKSMLNKKVQYFTAKELEDFLYNVKGTTAKIICDGMEIKYAKHKNEELFIDKSFIDITEKGIVSAYNHFKETKSIPLFDEKRRKELLEERPWEIKSVDKISEELVLTHHGIITSRGPILITIKECGEIEVINFKVAFCKKDVFRVEAHKAPIFFGIRDAMTYAANVDYLSYTSEPDFD